MFIEILAPSVSHRTRAKGLHYFRSGAVISIDGTPWVAHATVRGGRDYRVELVRAVDSRVFTGSCECPYYADRGEVCKHIWAALLQAERGALLMGDGPAPADAALEPASVPLHRPGSPTTGSRRAVQTRAPWQRFLQDLQSDLASAESAWPQPRFANGQLVYVIDARETLAGYGTVLETMFRHRKRGSEWAKPKPASLGPGDADHLADPADREIMSLLIGAAHPSAYSSAYDPYGRRSRFYLSSIIEARLLPLIVQTGRAHLVGPGEDRTLLPLSWDGGDPWRFDLRLDEDEEADAITVAGVFVRAGEQMPVTDPLLVVSSGFLFTRSTMARVELGGAFTWIVRLRISGPVSIPRSEAASLIETLARSGVDPSSLPSPLRYEVVSGTPKPRVRVRRPQIRNPYVERQDLQAFVQFQYDNSTVDASQAPSAANTYDPVERRMIRRDRAAEQTAMERLHQLGFRYTWSHFESRQMLGIAADQFSKVIAVLVREGWHVEADGRPFRSAQRLQVRVSSGIDWFDLDGSVEFGGGRTAPFPQLLAALRRGENVVVLDDGSVGLLPEEWLKRYAAVAAFGDADETRIRFKPSQAALLDALLEAQPDTNFDETFARVRAEMHTFAGIEPEDPPRTFHGTLRGYQREALGWFAFLRRFGFGGCLADDMGLGKTVMVLALLDARRASAVRQGAGTSLAVVPRSLVFNWKDEAARFAPKLVVLDHTGPSRDISRLGDAHLVLTTYGTMLRDISLLKDVEFDYVILDEAQAIKNAATASAKAARLLRATHRLALSGTPIENHLGELWSLFEFLNAGLLGPARKFQTGTRARPAEELTLLSRALRPFILRRTKEQVAPELPRRTEQTLHCELEGVQRKHYDELRAHYRQTLLARVVREGVNRSKMQILEALLRLRQAASHSGLIDPKRADEPSAKFEVLIPRLLEVIEEGHKALVFSQFTSLLGLLRPRLEALRITYEYLDGRTRDRASRVERFQTDPACSVFLVSLKAGGVGLNLTAAEYVFLLDPWWNPAVEAQAIDRAHRIGQTRHVFAYRLLAQDTVEEKVADLQQSKRALADAILTSDTSLVRGLRVEDLELLLS